MFFEFKVEYLRKTGLEIADDKFKTFFLIDLRLQGFFSVFNFQPVLHREIEKRDGFRQLQVN